MEKDLIYGAIADDDTGASDLAGMFAEGGLSTLLVIDLPGEEQMLRWTRGSEVVVMAEGTRNLSAELARERTRAAIRLLNLRRPRQFQIKYCSTFDSTPAGNIGPSIDAAMDELDESFTIAVPALPINGRTTYLGYHFVHAQLLSDSPMRHHPLTPMDNPYLPDLLGQQTRRKVGLIPFPVIERGADAIKEHLGRLRAEGVGVAVVDCLHDGHVASICQAAASLRLISGGSAFGIKMPDVWRRQGLLRSDGENLSRKLFTQPNGGVLIVAGSCSVATRAQNKWFVEQGGEVINITAEELLTGSDNFGAERTKLRDWLREGRSCLLATSGDPAEVRSVQNWWSSQGRDIPALGGALAGALANLVGEVMREQPIGGLIVAGGETSGAICRRLNLGALRVGRNIEPGVPLCYSLGEYRLPVVLKSGNFGGEDFYRRASQAVRDYPAFLNQ